MQDELIKAILTGAPVWVFAMAAAIVAVVFVYKALTCDDFEFLWFKFRRDKALRDLLHKSDAEVAILGGLVPLINMLHGELADLLAELADRPAGAPERIANLYTCVLAGITQVVRADGYHRAGVLFPETTNGQLQLGLAWSVSHSTTAKKGLKFPLSTIPGRVYSSGEYYYCRDTSQDRNFQHNPYSTHSYKSILCIPIKARNKVQGVLQIDAVKTNAFTNDDINTLHAFARYIAVLRQTQVLLNCDLEEVAPSGDSYGT